MNIREVIECLNEIAAALPGGLDSEVRVHICNGNDTPGVMTPSIVVDQMWVQDKRDFTVKGSFAVIQGHPHRDKDGAGSTIKPLLMEIDEVVQGWAAEQAGDGPVANSVDVTIDPDSGQRYAVIHRSGQKSIKLELSDEGTIRYPPGAPNAVEAGCTCDPIRNNQGNGAGEHDDGRSFIIKANCPLHELNNDPPP